MQKSLHNTYIYVLAENLLMGLRSFRYGE